MEKRRIRLEINGVVCGLITEESEEYMQSLAGEVGKTMQDIMQSSPYITREAAALTVALGYSDDLKKSSKRTYELQERIDEMELEAEIWQEEKLELLKSPEAGADKKLLEQLDAMKGQVDELKRDKEKLLLEVGKAAPEKERYDRELEEARLENESLQARLAQFLTAGFDEDEQEKQRGVSEELELLRAQLEEQLTLSEKAEEEKNSAVEAAKRAMEEARKVVDQLSGELEAAQQEIKELKEKNASPALDLLERSLLSNDTADEPVEISHDVSEPRVKKRRNPLRYSDDAEAQGFVSFFEKKERR